MLALTESALCANELSLRANTSLSNEGYFVLDWQFKTLADFETLPSDTTLILMQSNNANMADAIQRQKIPMQGESTLSGFENGDYFFRVESQGFSSNIVKVQVRHHSLFKAFGFFFAGLLLFFVLSASIFIGTKTHRSSAQ